MRGCSEQVAAPHLLAAAAAAARLAPIHPLLLKLRKTTLQNLPPYHPRMRAKTHAQILQGRLAPIGDFIVHAILAPEPEQTRGQVEIEICRHIAAEYWPLPVTEWTHLHVMAVYRNARFRAALG